MKGYDKLGPNAKAAFEKAHAKHMKAIGVVNKQFYSKDRIVSLKANPKEAVIEARFDHGELLKYTPRGTWH